MKRRSASLFIGGLACCWLLACSCATPSVGVERAIAIAKREVIKKYGWQDAELATLRAGEGRWQITLFRVPNVIGGHATVEVTNRGEVTSIEPGL